MDGIDWWDAALLTMVGYLAVTALLRLMLAYRDAKIADVKRQFAEFQRQQEALENSSAPANADVSNPPNKRRTAA